MHTQNRQTPGRVVQEAVTPRSYIVETPSENVRRTQSHLLPRPVEEEGIAVHTEPTGNQQSCTMHVCCSILDVLSNNNCCNSCKCYHTCLGMIELVQ